MPQKKDCQKAVALVQVGDNDGKSRAIAVGMERRGWIRGEVGSWEVRWAGFGGERPHGDRSHGQWVLGDAGY